LGAAISQEKSLCIFFASSEVKPFVKTGGLADVSYSLPVELGRLGHNVKVILPLYGSIDRSGFTRLPFTIEKKVGKKIFHAAVFSKKIAENTEALFIDQPELFGGLPNPYGDENGDYENNDERFIFFDLAVVELARSSQPLPDVIHSNDWQGGLIPLLLRLERGIDRSPLKGTVSVFSIHNLAYQGLFPKESFKLTTLPEELFSIDGVEQYGKLALLKSAILFADALTTVSPTYAREILTPELGFGLEPFLEKRKEDLAGILNGIDTDEWNPETDRLIPANFSINSLEGKSHCRKALIDRFGLTGGEDTPIFGMVSRLIEQKGCDIIADSAEKLMEERMNLVILGTGQKEYESFFTSLAKKHPGRVALKIGFDNTIAHLIEAGSDIFLMPSRFEPCGLNQMFSLRYGTVPLVRSTGGLADTVTDWTSNPERGNGFVFSKPEAGEFLDAAKRGIKAFGDRAEWTRIMRNGMSQDHSWKGSAKKYEELYLSLLEKGAKKPQRGLE